MMGRAYARVLPDPVGALMQTSCSALRPPAVMRQAAAWTGYSSTKPSAQDAACQEACSSLHAGTECTDAPPGAFSGGQQRLGHMLQWPAHCCRLPPKVAVQVCAQAERCTCL